MQLLWPGKSTSAGMHIFGSTICHEHLATHRCCCQKECIPVAEGVIIHVNYFVFTPLHGFNHTCEHFVTAAFLQVAGHDFEVQTMRNKHEHHHSTEPHIMHCLVRITHHPVCPSVMRRLVKLPHDSPGALDQAGGRTSSWKAAGHSSVHARCMNMSITTAIYGSVSHMQSASCVEVW